MFVTEKHEEHQLSKNCNQPTDERRLIHLHIPQIEKKTFLKKCHLILRITKLNTEVIR